MRRSILDEDPAQYVSHTSVAVMSRRKNYTSPVAAENWSGSDGVMGGRFLFERFAFFIHLTKKKKKLKEV